MKPVPGALGELLAGGVVEPSAFAGTSLSGWVTEDPHDLARETVFIEALKELAPAVVQAGAHPVVLGGVALWGREYPKAGSRRAYDIDLWIDPEERQVMTKTLTMAGFVSPPSHPMVWQRGPVEIDLHTHWLNDARRHVFDLVTTMSARDVWNHGEELPCCPEEPWRRPGAEDLWCLLALHAIKHEFERLNLVLDLQLLLERQAPTSELGKELLKLCAPAVRKLGLNNDVVGEIKAPVLAEHILLERPQRPFLAGLRLLAGLSSYRVAFWWRLFWGTEAMRRESSGMSRWARGWRRLN